MSEGETIAVFYEKFAVGHVHLSASGALSFAYDPRWLATRGNFPLSLTLPLRRGRFEEEIILPWLANLLPEEEQLAALSRALGLSTSDALALLREIGGDTAGAISIGEPSVRNDWTYESLQDHYGKPTESEALARHFEDLGKRPFLAGEDGVRLSLAGGQKKTALTVLDETGKPKLGLPQPGDRLAIPKNGAPSTIIIKPDNPRLPGIAENEAYCLTLAGLIGIAVAECTILGADGRKAMAVARYDRSLRKDGSLRRLHQEDFAQANGIYPGQKYEQGTIPGLDMARLLRTGDHLPPTDALALLDQMIFNILVANTDAHAKNYSILLGNGLSMAPLYDVSSVLHWDHVNQYHAQKIAGKRRKPADIAPRHWNEIARSAGLNASALRRRTGEIIDAMVAHRVEATERISSLAGATPEMVEHVAHLVEGNALRVGGRLRGLDGG
ncbi:type II toxin-antitoxin system HipA family toxin [Roseovarius nubinhibens]|uniref:type II toxin-antitoxin system HipA family toxin n=1 Tax=Roseovarius nubinhibens TaxID=314263 RepID=UPI001C09F6A9|nr:type II toxin-antitoxin system HipA family toxin [Roseovarius nubinhibens]MBU3000887.1 type II toxin-antitoxin system HipA family toxin [Roseovarius nubinhibens]